MLPLALAVALLASALYLSVVDSQLREIVLNCSSQMRRIFVYHPRYPPGPRLPLPLVGESWLLATEYDTMRSMGEWADSYGDALGFYMAHTRVVVLNSPELISEAMQKEEIAYRPNYPTVAKCHGITR